MLAFLKTNARWIAGGFLLTFFSSFGQTFFISLMGGYYREELDQSLAKANATVGGALFNKAKGGDTTAMIFWMKTQAGWREKQEIDHTSSDGSLAPSTIILRAAGNDNSDG